MVKLWEKSEIVKIAVKKRVQNTNNLIMSDDLKVRLVECYSDHACTHRHVNENLCACMQC